MTHSATDLLCVGRCSMDLFSEQLGASFEKIDSFSTSVGGSPSNIAIGTARLGLSSALFSAVGDDKVGDFVLTQLAHEGVATHLMPRTAGRTPLAVVGVQPPSTFPLVFYRENPSDQYLSLEHALAALPLACRALLISGTGLSKGSQRDMTLYMLEQAAHTNILTYIDLDLRPDQWSHPLAYGLNMRLALPLLDVIIGTEEELYATLHHNTNDPSSTLIHALSPSQISELETSITAYLDTPSQHHTDQVIVLKRGGRGVTLYRKHTNPLHSPAFSVDVVNTVGAGDAFASGLIYARLRGKDWPEALRLANACGAIVVSRHGCSKAMPTLTEVEAFLKTS